jgi:hypothetical protein
MKTSSQPPVARGESLWWRGVWALPLFLIFLAARTILGTSVSNWLPLVEEAARTGWVEDVSGRVPVKMIYTGIEGFDGFVRGFVAFFTPALAGLGHRESNTQQLNESSR